MLGLKLNHVSKRGHRCDKSYVMSCHVMSCHVMFSSRDYHLCAVSEECYLSFDTLMSQFNRRCEWETLSNALLKSRSTQSICLQHCGAWHILGSFVIIWGSFSTERHRDLHMLQGRALTVQGYIVGPCAVTIGPQCQISYCPMQFLRERSIKNKDWPAHSPDFNPMKHI